jgi:hypothetical protein
MRKRTTTACCCHADDDMHAILVAHPPTRLSSPRDAAAYKTLLQCLKTNKHFKQRENDCKESEAANPRKTKIQKLQHTNTHNRRQPKTAIKGKRLELGS